jgi:cytochrome c553
MRAIQTLTCIAAALSALSVARADDSIVVDPNSFQGRTQAAIEEFRAAVALEPDLQHGAELFKSCAACHQADGSGSDDGTVPVIAGQHVSVLVKQLVDFRHDRRWDSRMRGAAKGHELADAQDLLDVAAFAQGLRRPPPREGGTGDGSQQHEGQVVYYRECAECHGRLGEGDLRTVRPRLAGQHYLYMLRQLYETAEGTRPGMDELHRKRIGALSDADRAAVADYLSHLSPGFSSVP